MTESSEAALKGTERNPDQSCLGSLLPALRRLDLLLEDAVNAAAIAYGAGAAHSFRGLHISQDDVERLLAREPGAPVLHTEALASDEFRLDLTNERSRLAWLKQTFCLSSFDVDLILIALAPELDLRYERLYAFLQDDVTRKGPGIDLALNLLCSSAEEKLARRTRFGTDAPLIRHGLLRVIADPNLVQPPLLAHYLKLDEQITRFLLGEESLDARLVSFCKVVHPRVQVNELPLRDDAKAALPTLVKQARESCEPLRLYFYGPHGTGKRRTAEALAREIETSLLIVDLEPSLAADTSFAQTLRLIFREALFRRAVLYLEGLDSLRRDGRSTQFGQLTELLIEDPGITILAGVRPWIPSGRVPTRIISVPFPIPDFAERRNCWGANLEAAGITLDARVLEPMASRFRLTPEQIAEAVGAARDIARWQTAVGSRDDASASNAALTASDLFTAARKQSGQDLAALAHKIEPIYTWPDIVLPADTVLQLREMCQRVARRQQVLGQWGFDRKLSLGKGVNALFAGPSGTGKTMAAEIIANELELDLYKIDLSGVVSKYIGETEKNLDRIFTTAENANAILFFDEADALFGKRSEVRDSHDRYANIEISYLLQKMEQYEGVAILATNLRQNMDEAFTRRLQFIIEFPFPDEAHRRQIWEVLFPPEAPLEAEIDLDFLARQFRLAGGNIKNIVLSAAFLAASDGGRIGMEHLVRATWRECRKLGRALGAGDFGKYAEVIK